MDLTFAVVGQTRASWPLPCLTDDSIRGSELDLATPQRTVAPVRTGHSMRLNERRDMPPLMSVSGRPMTRQRSVRAVPGHGLRQTARPLVRRAQIGRSIPKPPNRLCRMPNYSFDARIAVIGPAGLPKPIGQKYYGDFKTVVAQKEVQDAFTAQGIAVINSTLEQAARAGIARGPDQEVGHDGPMSPGAWRRARSSGGRREPFDFTGLLSFP